MKGIAIREHPLGKGLETEWGKGLETEGSKGETVALRYRWSVGREGGVLRDEGR